MLTNLYKKIFLSLLIFGVFIVFPQKIYAITAIINSVDVSNITSKDQEILINTTISGSFPTEYYLRVGMKEGNKYVGYVKNNINEWIKIGTLDSDKIDNYCFNYFKIDSEGEYVLKFKIGNEDEISNGSHIFKIHRFTPSCGSTDIAKISINVSLPTPIPTQTPSSTSSPTPTSVSSPTKTSTPTPKPIATKRPTTKPIKTSQSESSESGFVLSDISIGNDNSTPTPEGEVAGLSTSKNFPFQAVGLIISGMGFMGYGGFSLYKRSKNQYNDKSEENI